MTSHETQLELLGAYVDGELSPDGRHDVEGLLARDAEARALVEALRSQRAGLQSLFAPVLDEPVPLPLLAAARRRPGLRRWGRIAAALAVAFLAGAGAGWGGASLTGLAGSGANGEQRLVNRAAMAHAVFAPEVRHPVEVAAAEKAHLVTWLSRRLGHPIKAPVLADAGFELVGGRLLPDASTPAAQFMYEDRGGRRVTLYLRVDDRENRETAFRWAKQGNVEVCYWIDGRVGYALAGEFGRPEITQLAKLIYDQIEG